MAIRIVLTYISTWDTDYYKNEVVFCLIPFEYKFHPLRRLNANQGWMCSRQLGTLVEYLIEDNIHCTVTWSILTMVDHIDLRIAWKSYRWVSQMPHCFWRSSSLFLNQIHEHPLKEFCKSYNLHSRPVYTMGPWSWTMEDGLFHGLTWWCNFHGLISLKINLQSLWAPH